MKARNKGTEETLSKTSTAGCNVTHQLLAKRNREALDIHTKSDPGQQLSVVWLDTGLSKVNVSNHQRVQCLKIEKSYTTRKFMLLLQSRIRLPDDWKKESKEGFGVY